MSNAQPNDALVEALRQSAHVIQQLKTELASYNEPIAIIGMSCRFPQADSPEAFWQLLANKLDIITEVPPQRWDLDDYYDATPGTAGKMYTRYAGFLEDIEQFDPYFFGISTKEAPYVDPQQRLLLEVTWEALERAAQASDQLLNSQTGVFVGISGSDYRLLQREPDKIQPYTMSGSGTCFAPGRLSYILGLQGPAFSIDTACSSSLVATHLACQSLRNQECDLALAGGVNIILAPDFSISGSQVQGFSPDGRSKTFDERADGTSRGEGCGVLVLKRLSDAMRDHDNILAVVRGNAINHDGPSSGLSVPNKAAQEAVIQQALQSGKLQPHHISYIEAHGVGTPLGDPIEIRALSSVFDDTQRHHPLIVGSGKTNIGHTEAAAGVAGVLKAVLALQHDAIPPNLHFQTPNPHIDWQNIPVTIPTEHTTWPEGTKRAGVNSFGASGTNAHIIVEEAPEPEPMSSSEQPWHLLTLSAKTKQALSDLAARYQTYFNDHPDVDLADVCYTAQAGRSHFEYRLSLTAPTATEMQQLLADFQRQQAHPGIKQGKVPKYRVAPKTAFLFTGQGTQYPEMGRDLYETQPTFKQTIDQCDKILQSLGQPSLIEYLYTAPAKTINLQAPLAQAALFAVEYGLTQLWQSWGITPQVVMGHSLGEYVAACYAGVFSVADGLKLVVSRAKLMESLPMAQAATAAVIASETDIVTWLEGYPDISISAINAPNVVLVSGPRSAVEALAESLREQNIRIQIGQTPGASHSPLLEPILADFEQIVRTISLQRPQVPFVSSITGQLADDELTEPAYWRQHLRSPVRFADGMLMLLGQGLNGRSLDIFIEVGPKPDLLALARQCYDHHAKQQADATMPALLPSLRRGRNNWQQLLECVAELYVLGVNVNWTAMNTDLTGNTNRCKVVLPTYPFQRQRYWLEDLRPSPLPSSNARQRIDQIGPFLDTMVQSPLIKETIFETSLSVERYPFLNDHRVMNQVVVPGVCYLTMVLNAMARAFPEQSGQIENVVFPQALVIPEDGDQKVQLVFTPLSEEESTSRFEFQLISVDSATKQPIVQATGSVVLQSLQALPTIDLTALQQQCQELVSIPAIYEAATQRKVWLGPNFQWLVDIHRDTTDEQAIAIGKLKMPIDIINQGGIDSYQLPPGLLDACFQVAGTTLVEIKELLAPFAVEQLELHQAVQGNEWWCLARQVDTYKWDIQLLDIDGRLLAVVTGFEMRAVSTAVLQGANVWQQWLYQVEWQSCPIYGQSAPYLLTPPQLQQQLARFLPTLQNDIPQSRAPEVEAALKQASLAYILSALNKAGFDMTITQPWTLDELNQQMRIIPKYRHVLRRWLELLTEANVLHYQPKTEQWQVNQAVPNWPQPDLTTLPPDHKAEVELLQRYGEKLLEIGRGIQAPQALRVVDEVDVVAQFYEAAPAHRLLNQIVSQALEATSQWLPADRGLRILEIGAGTGSSTAALLAGLPEGQISYSCTDPQAEALAQLQAHLAAYDFVNYAVLDIAETPPEGQFDLIVGVNALAGRKDVQATLQHLRQGLAPDGLLWLIEATTPQTHLEISLGLVEQWQHFEAKSTEALEQLFAKTGFKATAVNTGSPYTLFLAQADEIKVESKPTWLLLRGETSTPIAEGVADQLRQRGHSPILVNTPTEVDDYAKLFTDVNNLQGIIHLASLDAEIPNGTAETQLPQAIQQSCGTALWLTQAVLKHYLKPPQLWFITQAAQSLNEEESLAGLSQAPLWGLVKTLIMEHPELPCTIVDIDNAATPEQQAEAIFTEIIGQIPYNPRENEVALRLEQSKSTRYVPRLTRHPKRSLIVPQIRAEGSYLITGGLGGLGLLMAQWLVNKGARHLVLVGRSQPSAEVQTQLADLMAQGVNIVTRQADVTDFAQMAATIEVIPEASPLCGVIHTAGTLDDGAILQQNWSRFETVLAPKAFGAWHLHQLTQDLALDFFVLFSSVAGLFGNRGQANYTAANTFLDALARHRQAQGLPGLSINWDTWSEVGAMAEVVEQQQQAMQALGRGAITPIQGLPILEYLLGHNIGGSAAALAIDWQTFIAQQEPLLPLFAEFIEARSSTNRQSITPLAEFRQQLAQVDPDERGALLTQHIQQIAAQIMGLPSPDDLAPDQSVMEMGLDSLMAIELRNDLQNSLGHSLPAMLLFGHPTIESLVDYLLDELFEADKVDDTDTDDRTKATPKMITTEAEEINGTAPASTETIAKQLAKQLGLDWENLNES